MTGREGPVLCVGEAMVLVSPIGSRALATADAFEVTVAGAEANVARFLADLGIESGGLSSVGHDPLGGRILSNLSTCGVDTRWVAQAVESPTGAFFKDPAATGSRVFYYRTGSAFSRMTAADTARWPLERACWVHVSGVTPALSQGCLELTATVLQRCRAAGVPVSFDVNYRPSLWAERDAASVLLGIAVQADVVFVGLDEAQLLWGVTTAAHVAAYLSGAGIVVVKDSDRVATEFASSSAGGVITAVPARKIADMVDPVGAGDAFAAGYLAELLRGRSAEERLEMAHSVAAWTLSTSHDFRSGHGRSVRSLRGVA